MATFGTMTLLVVSVHNFAGIMTLRWFLGMAVCYYGIPHTFRM